MILGPSQPPTPSCILQIDVSRGGAGKTALKRLNVLHNKVLRAMTYSSYKSRVSPLYKKLNLLKIDDIYILEIGKFMHRLQWGRIPVNFDQLFTPVS